MNHTSFSGKKVGILGFAVNNEGLADFLLSEGASVSVLDEKEENEFDDSSVSQLREKGIVFIFGPFRDLGDFDVLVRTPGVKPRRKEIEEAQASGTEMTSVTNIFFERCQCPVIGVTGTKGKGTTATLIFEMLKEAGRDVHLLGNIGVPVIPALQRLSEDSIVVYELSSFQLMDISKSPHVAVVLMTTSEHMDFHEDEEEYVTAKANIVKFQGEEDIAIFNADYENSRKIAEGCRSRKFWVSGRHALQEEGCFVSEGDISLVFEGQKEVLMKTKDVLLPGEHNLENACAAAMAAKTMGAGKEIIAEVLRTFKGLPDRLETVREVGGVKYVNDTFSTTPETAIAAIKAFSGPKIIILGGSSKGSNFSELGREIASNGSVKAVVGIGDEWPRIREAIEMQASESGESPPELYDGGETMEEIVKAASSFAEKGDVILLSPACASFDMFKNYKERGRSFKEEVVKL